MLGVRAGISVNPETDVKIIESVLNEVERFAMSVHPALWTEI